MKRNIIYLIFVILFVFGKSVSAQDVDVIDIPDKNLEQAIRNEIGVPNAIQLGSQHLKMLTELNLYNKSITSITGLEFATNLSRLDLGNNSELNDIRSISNLTKLTWLSLARTQIQNLNPLIKLTKLEILYIWVTPVSDLKPLTGLINLISINAGSCKISDVAPLATLTKLKSLGLQNNLIKDVTPLSNLTQLIDLDLRFNQIVDVRPLSKLTNLDKLRIQGNEITDHSPLDTLSLTVFEYDQSCVLERLSILERMQNRRFPSIVSAWGGLGWSSVLNLPEKSDLEQMALHDLYFCCLIFNQEFRDTSDGKRIMGEMEQATKQRDEFLAQNPNMLFIVGLEMREAYPENHAIDSPYWLRDENGERIVAWQDGGLLLDFTNPVVIDKIVNEAIAVAKCGLYDGIFFDWWNEHQPVIVTWLNESIHRGIVFRGNEEEQRARDEILTRIRAEVDDDFLILVNGNRSKMPRTGWAINGTFMETGRDNDEGYTDEGLKVIESTLSWAEENLREPRINCLEGWGVTTQSPDSPLNKKWMRVFTTMNLTHSDGYVLYNDGIQHRHYWYDFWNTDLGTPIGEKTQLYKNREGLFIREYTNGWAVYNRSGQAQEISFLVQTTGVASGSTRFKHTVPNLDGDMFLKTDVTLDVNGDGDVNILDLVVIANAFGKKEPDLNGDGVVNIQDLVIIANAI
ncbi:hypothetical protein JT359_13175 [Candidatus Poribacteria bacterium]|nr:hypothetical protein [Candidatus Poribacteria bacterium]